MDLVGPSGAPGSAGRVGAHYPGPAGKPTPDPHAARTMPPGMVRDRHSLPDVPSSPLAAAIAEHSYSPPSFGLPPRSFTATVPGEDW